MAKKEKFVIIDGNALLHRSFHALPLLTTKTGELVNAVYGFVMVLLKMFKDINPDYLAVTFDTKAPTFRHQLYKEYKATRVKQPQELYDQIPRLKEILTAFHIPVFTKDGFEADDLLGTICSLRAVDKPGLETIIMTGDLDTLQLVDANTKVYTLKRGVTDTVFYDEKSIQERYGLQPEQLVEFKALRGDPSDNILGVKGIGEKTAVALLQQFGTIENLYNALEKDEKIELGEKIKKTLLADKKHVLENIKLVRIKRDVPIDFKLDACLRQPFDRQAVVKLFQEMEFHSLLKRLPEASESSEEKQKQAAQAVDYQLIETTSQLEKLSKQLQEQQIFAFDIITDSISQEQTKVLGLGLCWEPGKAFFIPAHLHPVYFLRDLFADAQIKKIGHNLKNDWKILQEKDIALEGIAFDTMLAAYLLNPGSRKYDLDALVFSEFGREIMTVEKLLVASKGSFGLAFLSLKQLMEYGCSAVDYTFRLAQKLEKKLQENNMLALMGEIEIPLIEVLGQMEQWGVQIDCRILEQINEEVTGKLHSLEKKIYQLAGKEFNINSPAQLREILFQGLKIAPERLGKTKTGISTAAEELEKLQGKHPIIDLIIEYRELMKLKTTYLDALPQLVDHKTGRIHTHFNQTITATGRLSSSEPNLQNIPAHTKFGQEIRRAFVAPAGSQILKVDYSQIELRIIASLSGDEKMLAAFQAGEDIHQRTAAELWNCKLEEITPKMRHLAKTINFGVIYGMGQNALAQSAGIRVEEARNFIEHYFSIHQGIADFQEKTKTLCRERGYVETLFGRRRFLPEIKAEHPGMRSSAERMAINMPVQGTAADIIKKAMTEIYQWIKKEYGIDDAAVKMIIQVHDELVFEVKKEEIEKATKEIKKIMEGACQLKTPLTVSLSSGKSWGALL